MYNTMAAFPSGKKMKKPTDEQRRVESFGKTDEGSLFLFAACLNATLLALIAKFCDRAV